MDVRAGSAPHYLHSVQTPPEGFDEPALREALRAWRIDAVSLTYTPVGFGDHHWTATGPDDRRHFVTVADLAHKTMYGEGPETAWRGLHRAMRTAAALRHDSGLDFVVAPLPAAEPPGETLIRIDPRYAVTVFPFLDATSRHFSQALSPQERTALVDLLTRLHRTPAPTSTPVSRPELPTRPLLENAMRDTGRPWHGGPYAEPARTLIADRAPALRRRLEEFDRRARELQDTLREPVLTHGEPHPGNLLFQDRRLLLVDWDTVALSHPERDLWLVTDEPDDLARYGDATGHRPNPSALAFYRLRWDLADLAAFLGDLRSPHTDTADTKTAWDNLAAIVRHLASTS